MNRRRDFNRKERNVILFVIYYILKIITSANASRTFGDCTVFLERGDQVSQRRAVGDVGDGYGGGSLRLAKIQPRWRTARVFSRISPRILTLLPDPPLYSSHQYHRYWYRRPTKTRDLKTSLPWVHPTLRWNVLSPWLGVSIEIWYLNSNASRVLCSRARLTVSRARRGTFFYSFHYHCFPSHHFVLVPELKTNF